MSIYYHRYLIYFSIITLVLMMSLPTQAQFDTDSKLKLMMRMFTQGNILEGEKLFHDPQLGQNGKSCTDCHGKDKRYQLGQKVVSLQIAAWIQYCYQKYQQGKSVMDEKKLYDLFAYIKFIQR